jgi:hypothetical protein
MLLNRQSSEHQQEETLRKILEELCETRKLQEKSFAQILEELESNTTILGKVESNTTLLQQIAEDLAPEPELPTGITFQENTMLPTVGGNTLIYTGTLSPVGSAFTTETFSVTSNDPAVLPTVDSTGLIVTVPLPAGWVESTTVPLAIQYSTSAPASLAATITPSSPPATTPTGITFVQSQ